MTTVEIEQLLNEEGIDLKDETPSPIDPLIGEASFATFFTRNRGSGSGGYAENVLLHAVKELFNDDLDRIEFKTLRNNDFLETRFEKDGQTLLKFGIANGFRNIQNVVQKMKRKRCDFHFVEIMACPSGCLNGGAQIRPGDEEGVSGPELVSKLVKKFEEIHIHSATLKQDTLVQRLYDDWLGGRYSDKAAKLLYTEYHEIEKDVNSLAIKW